MPRYFAEIKYNGTHYHGWQRQPNALGVQQVVEERLSDILREQVAITASGRTDTGVHCHAQWFHFDAELPETAEVLCQKLNRYLPDDVALVQIVAVTDEAHARFSAQWRTYRYFVSLQKDPFRAGRMHLLHDAPELNKMNAFAEQLLHHTDYTAFSKKHTDVHTHECSIRQSVWRGVPGANMLTFEVTANRFLRGMVRIIVGNSSGYWHRQAQP